jgi:hypothetical protein
VWKNIRASMIELMDSAQQALRLQEQCQAYTKRGVILQDLLREYRGNQPRDTAIPTIGDLAIMDEYRAYFNDDPAQVMTQDDFKAREVPLPEVVDVWRIAVEQRLIENLSGDVTMPAKKSLDASVLHLVTTLFKCYDCSAAIGYPAVLLHRCYRRFTPWTEVSAQMRRFYEALGCMPWNSGRIALKQHKVGFEVARILVYACGRGPSTMTAAEMDGLNPRFACLGCRRDDSSTEASTYVCMTWRNAVSANTLAGTSDTDVLSLA